MGRWVLYIIPFIPSYAVFRAFLGALGRESLTFSLHFSV